MVASFCSALSLILLFCSESKSIFSTCLNQASYLGEVEEGKRGDIDSIQKALKKLCSCQSFPCFLSLPLHSDHLQPSKEEQLRQFEVLLMSKEDEVGTQIPNVLCSFAQFCTVLHSFALPSILILKCLKKVSSKANALWRQREDVARRLSSASFYALTARNSLTEYETLWLNMAQYGSVWLSMAQILS